MTKPRNHRSVWDCLQHDNALPEFFDEDYWALSPQTLRAIRPLTPRFCRSFIDRALESLRETPTTLSLPVKAAPAVVQVAATPTLPLPSPEALTATMEEGFRSLQNISARIPLPSIEDLTAEIEANAQTPSKIWFYGEPLIEIRNEFAMAALNITLAALGNPQSAGAIAPFMTHLAKARAALAAYEANLKQPQTRRWLGFSGRAAPSADLLGEAIGLTRSAGQALQNFAPHLSQLEKQAVGKMDLFSLMASINDKLSLSAERHIDAARPFLQEGAGALALESESAACLTGRVGLLAQILVRTRQNEKADKASVALFRQQAQVFACQRGTTGPDLADSVSYLHRTLDLLQGAEATRDIAAVSATLGPNQVHDLLLAADRNLAAIDQTLQSTQASLQALDQETATLLAQKGLLPPEREKTALPAGPAASLASPS